jgi:hypothetical protein
MECKVSVFFLLGKKNSVLEQPSFKLFQKPDIVFKIQA